MEGETSKVGIEIGVSIVLGLVLVEILKTCYSSFKSPIWIFLSGLASLIVLATIFWITSSDKDRWEEWKDKAAISLFLISIVNLPYAILRTNIDNIILWNGSLSPNTWGYKSLCLYIIVLGISLLIYSWRLHEVKKVIAITVGILIILLGAGTCLVLLGLAK